MTVLKPVALNVSSLSLGSPLAISLDLIKAHCAVDGDDLDALLETYLASAIRWAENAMHRTVLSRTHVWTLADFPRDGWGSIRLPRGLCTAVDAVTYVDQDGATQTLAGASSSPVGTGYQETLTSEDGGIIQPAIGSGGWPQVHPEALAPVAITFQAGYAAAEIPEDIVHAIMFAVADMLDTRGSADLTVFGKNLTTRLSLVSPYCLVRWY
jgi:uncharacterized phiE125 gp8 family phage protein